MTIRVMVLDRHPIVRIGLRSVLDEQGDIAVVAQAAKAGAIGDALRAAAVDLIVLDLPPDGRMGIDSLLGIRRHAPSLPILVFSASPSARYAGTLKRIGCGAYVCKTAEPAEIVAAIRRLYACRSARPGSPGKPLDGTEGPRHDSLTSREFHIFLLLARGETNDAVARAVSLSAGTVSTYRSRLVRKLGLDSNSALTRYAIDEGLI